VTLPSPQLTERRLPDRLHETRQTVSGNFPAGGGAPLAEARFEEGSRAVFTQGEVGESFVQISTDLSWEAVAI